jgi:hypothetical protein
VARRLRFLLAERPVDIGFGLIWRHDQDGACFTENDVSEIHQAAVAGGIDMEAAADAARIVSKRMDRIRYFPFKSSHFIGNGSTASTMLPLA